MINSIEFFKQLNDDSKRIFSLIQKKGPLTKSSLIELTGLKLTTLNRAMEPLEDQDILVEYGTGISTGGRKPSLYRVNSSKYYVIGIDISRTYFQVVITNLNMEIKYKKLAYMDETYTPYKTTDAIADMISQGLSSLEEAYVLGAGIGTVGPLDRVDGRLLNPINFPAPGWIDVPIKDMLESKIGYGVFIDNGANTSVIAEFLFGCGKHYSNIAYFNCGVGIRTGAISSGIAVRSINNNEDAFGHMVVDVDGELCSCGNYGCIECYSSIPSIIKKFIALVKKGRRTLVNKSLESITFIDISNGASLGDELCIDVITSAAYILGAGLANYINLLNPGMVILSGPLISSSELFYHISTEIASSKYYSKEACKVDFSRGGHFGDNAISVGAAAMVIEKLLGSSI